MRGLVQLPKTQALACLPNVSNGNCGDQEGKSTSQMMVAGESRPLLSPEQIIPAEWSVVL
jgi:hypothetical protein